jgi:hypothetical protein
MHAQPARSPTRRPPVSERSRRAPAHEAPPLQPIPSPQRLATEEAAEAIRARHYPRLACDAAGRALCAPTPAYGRLCLAARQQPCLTPRQSRSVCAGAAHETAGGHSACCGQRCRAVRRARARAAAAEARRDPAARRATPLEKSTRQTQSSTHETLLTRDGHRCAELAGKPGLRPRGVRLRACNSSARSRTHRRSGLGVPR